MRIVGYCLSLLKAATASLIVSGALGRNMNGQLLIDTIFESLTLLDTTEGFVFPH